MFCGNCGEQIDDNAKICQKCKARTSTEEVDYSVTYAIFGKLSNSHSYFVYPKIPSDVSRKARDSFGVSFEEEILLVADTSLLKRRNQGLCMTDQRIYVIPNSSDSSLRYVLNWFNIKSVEYKDLIMRFIDSNNRSRSIDVSLFTMNKENHINDRIGQLAVDYFNYIAENAMPLEGSDMTDEFAEPDSKKEKKGLLNAYINMYDKAGELIIGQKPSEIISDIATRLTSKEENEAVNLVTCEKCSTRLEADAIYCSNCNAELPPQPIDFNEVTAIFKDDANKYDCLVYPKISSDDLRAARDNFGISFEEEILFIRDTSTWSNKNQGLCLTNRYIYVIPDNDDASSKFVIDWYDVNSVEYKDLIVRFIYNNNNYTPISISLFAKTDNSAKQNKVGQEVVKFFNKMARSMSPTESEGHIAMKQYKQLFSDGKYDEAIRFAFDSKESVENGAYIFFESAEAYCMKGDFERAVEICDECLSDFDADGMVGLISSRKGYYLLKQGEIVEARKLLNASRALLPSGAKDDDTGEIYADTARNNFKEAEECLISNFTKLPYNQRKLIVPVRKYATLDQTAITVIALDQIAKSDISFPIGHPVANQMYVGHPYIANKYLPFDRYELELLEDKIREFCQIAQSFGATEITIDSSNSTSNDSRKSVVQNSEAAGIGAAPVAAAGSLSQTSDNSLITEISQTINLNQRYSPKGNVTLPDKLVWYPNEPSWQRLYEQRLAGTLNHHEEKIEMRKSRVVDGTESMAIEAELVTLILAVKGKMDKTTKEKLSNQENAILSIHVDFAPLDALSAGVGTQQSLKSSGYTPEEEEYLQEVKECIAEFGEIGGSSRRLLSRIQKSLGITDERAAELEASLAPSLTEDESAYLEEYKLSLEESGGTLSDMDRRLLNRLRGKLDITEERAAEIESLA